MFSEFEFSALKLGFLAGAFRARPAAGEVPRDGFRDEFRDELPLFLFLTHSVGSNLLNEPFEHRDDEREPWADERAEPATEERAEPTADDRRDRRKKSRNPHRNPLPPHRENHRTGTSGVTT